MGHLNIIIAVGGEEGWELERTNLQKFKHQVEGGRSGRKGVAREGRGSLGKEAGRLRGGVPERGEIPGEGGSPGGKLRLRIDRRKKRVLAYLQIFK